MSEEPSEIQKPEQGPQLVPFGLYAEKSEQVAELERLATHDPLTRALNREGLRRHLEKAQPPQALLIVDATNFKAVNDKYGYGTGDQLVIHTYELLRRSIRPDDIIARWGGDEYLILLSPVTKRLETAANESNRRQELSDPVENINVVKDRIAQEVAVFLSEQPELVSVNFDLAVGGIAWTDGISIQNLIAQAEQEMKLHKARQHQNGSHR